MAVQPRQKTIFDNVQIRDTNARNPQAMLDLSDAQNWFYDIFNGHDQTVTLDLVGSSADEPGTAPLIGATVTIAANTRAPWVTNFWTRFQSVRVSYTVQPTAGQITIIGVVQPKA